MMLAIPATLVIVVFAYMLPELAPGGILVLLAAAPPDLAAVSALVGAARPVEVGLLIEVFATVAAHLCIKDPVVALLHLLNAFPEANDLRYR